MKVRIEFTLEVDPDRYRSEYNEYFTDSEIRTILKNDSRDAALQHFSDYGVQLVAEHD